MRHYPFPAKNETGLRHSTGSVTARIFVLRGLNERALRFCPVAGKLNEPDKDKIILRIGDGVGGVHAPVAEGIRLDKEVETDVRLGRT